MENGFEKDFAVVWPAPGIGDMQGGIGRTRLPAQNLNHFTAATGPAIFRGHRLPADMKGNLLFTEPVGRLIRRAAIENVEGLTLLRNVYPSAEFMTSNDQLFRPVNISNAPDGTLYIADMYHGIIQELQWSGPGIYLRAKIEQYQLDKVVGARPDLAAAVRRPAGGAGNADEHRPAGDSRDRTGLRAPRMYSETPAQLVTHLTHPNGWWRDMAQRLLILKQDKSVVPALEQIARTSDNEVARFHALWTLEGLSALNPRLVRDAMQDPPAHARPGHSVSETLYKAGDKSFANDYRALAKDRTPSRDPGDADAEPVQAAGCGGRDQVGQGRQQGEGRRAHRRSPACAGADQLRRRTPRSVHAGGGEAPAAGQRGVRRRCVSRAMAPTAWASRWPVRRRA